MEKFLLFPALLLLSLQGLAQLRLKDQPLSISPYGYTIVEVLDERSTPLPQQELQLHGGTAKAIKAYLDKNLLKSQSELPLMMQIQEFSQTAGSPLHGRTEGQIRLKVSFSVKKNDGREPLVGFSGGLRYSSHGNAAPDIPRYLLSVLEASLTYLNNWIKENENVNRKLAKGVKIRVSDYLEANEGDTIYYSAKRPLTWADFKSRRRAAGRFSATVMPSIGYDQRAEMVKGIIEVDIALKAYLPKSASWASSDNRNAYTLNHEQRHFDIVKIIAEQFKQRLLSAQLTPDTFEAFINMQYLDYFRAMDAMQKAYDLETNHGGNTMAQESWNRKIDKDLAEFIESFPSPTRR